ncbi:unnamed protein product [Sphenostylis stenocarpa]|uniref:F-box domain-containing protein n=1 Tax=Sphenostylis stenocarpa TaxID=92480 RepID=A0AA86SHQ3_9FABA|nr:unnamed protein product [Sphenostylis stenocarpa]
MADWSELPKDLLYVISQRLQSPLYLLHFRSVCSSWRSSGSFSSPFLFSHSITLTPTFSLSHRSLLLLKPPSAEPHHRPWLVKISHDPRARTARLFHALSRSKPKPPRFALDLRRFPALDLGHEFRLSNACSSVDSLYDEKLVLLPADRDRFALLTIHVSGKLALFFRGDSAWTIIPEMPTPYDDVCAFRDTFYAVDGNGRTVTVGFDGALRVVAECVFGGDKKFLVECDGALMMVDLHLSTDYEYLEEEDIGYMGWERTVKFDVFRLEEEVGRWVEVANLGEWVLFLGDDCAFSASAKDLGVERGNCVVFRDDRLGGVRVANGVGVYDLGDGRISPLWECPSFSELFWPPPVWVRSR